MMMKKCVIQTGLKLVILLIWVGGEVGGGSGIIIYCMEKYIKNNIKRIHSMVKMQNSV